MNIEQLLARLRSLAATLTLSQQVSLAVSFVLVVALVGGSAYYLNQDSYGLLFTDMDPESAADVVSKLKERKVPYLIGDGGRVVRVPESRLDELRLEFSAQGLPGTGRIGFEIFDRTNFGATEFLEQVNYRRALEGELARTIATLSEVAGARVHIALSKPPLFGPREPTAKASVVLKLRGSRPLAPGTAYGIASLVAGSVEGLRPDGVMVLDSYGRPLLRTEDEGADGTGVPVERQRRLERELTAQVMALLEPVVGAGRVRVNVAVRLNAESEDRTEERWDPSASAIRSHQTSSDAATGRQLSGGLAGARANLPAPASPADATAAAVPAAAPSLDRPVVGRVAETTNYELSRSVRHVIRPSGEIARLSVAVILDDEMVPAENGEGTGGRRARSPEQVQKIQTLVATAVGLDPDRGDQLTVDNVSFDDRPVGNIDEPGVWGRYGPQLLDGARIAVVLLFGLAALLLVVRPLMRRAIAPTPPARPAAARALPQPGEGPRTIQELEGSIEAELDAAMLASAGETRKVPVLSRRLSGMAQKEPEHAARLLRAWLSEDKR